MSAYRSELQRRHGVVGVTVAGEGRRLEIRGQKAENRDGLARIAANELGGVNLDEAVRVVSFEHQSPAPLAWVTTDPEAAGSYLARQIRAAATDRLPVTSLEALDSGRSCPLEPLVGRAT